ncbi:MAG: methylenetetrahydrofolate reductase [Roseovarius sp.]|nr:methylenetetrahydrofolate reductase [Roseovarius sp.]
MSGINLFKRKVKKNHMNTAFESFLKGFSIEVMPRTAEKIKDFRQILPSGTRVYIAHIEGTPINDMVATARRISDEGFPVMPHFPARIVKDRKTLAEWIARYRNEAGVEQALVLAGGISKPQGDFESSMQLLETGEFGKAEFKRLHVAGHPEGNRDIDPDGSNSNVDAAIRWKQAFSETSNAEMAIATQFMFDPQPAIKWADNLKKSGVNLPVHIGIAGPAKLQTLIKFAVACGVGPSLKVLQRRALDVTKLIMPYEPNEMLDCLAGHKSKHPESNIANVHFFPLGGIMATAKWVMQNGGDSGRPKTSKDSA